MHVAGYLPLLPLVVVRALVAATGSTLSLDAADDLHELFEVTSIAAR